MALNISAVEKEVRRVSSDIILNALQTIPAFAQVTPTSITNAVPNTKYTIPVLDATITLRNCCETTDSASTAKTVSIETACVSAGDKYCNTDLIQILGGMDTSYRLNGNNPQAPRSAVEALLQTRANAFVNETQKLLFQGDKTQSQANINKLNGYVKIATDDSAVQKETVSTGNPYDLLIGQIKKLSDNARLRGNIKFFVPTEFADAYTHYMLRSNNISLMEMSGDNGALGGALPIPGFSQAVVVPTFGLNGTKKILVSPESNLIWAGNKGSASDVNYLADFAFVFDHASQRWVETINAIMGVGIANGSEVRLVTYQDAVLNVPAGNPVFVTNAAELKA